MLKKLLLTGAVLSTGLFANITAYYKYKVYDPAQNEYVPPGLVTGASTGTVSTSPEYSNLFEEMAGLLESGGENVVDNDESTTSDVIKVINFNTLADDMTSKLINSGYDEIDFVVSQPLLDKSEGVTVYNRVLNTNKRADADFINLPSSADKYFIGVSSKNMGFGAGFVLSKKQTVTDHKTKETIFSLKRINWVEAYSDYIQNYCRVKGYAPVWILNTLNFSNWTAKANSILSEGTADAYTSLIGKKSFDGIPDNGIVLLNTDEETLCDKTKKEIGDYLLSLKTWNMPDAKGYFSASKEVDGNSKKLFLKNGFLINYPYNSYYHIDEIMGSFFTTYMFINNIDRGIMISDTRPSIHTDTWTTGKYPWDKTYHVKKTINIGKETYDIMFNSYLSPFNEYSLSTDWNSVNNAYINVLNQLPAITRNLKNYTPQGHLMTHAFKKGGEVSSTVVPGWSYSHEVSKKAGFNWFAFIVTIVVIGATAYVGSLYFASGAFASGTAFSTFVSNTLASISLSSSLMVGSFTAMAATAGAAMATVQTVGSWFVKEPSNTNGGIIATMKSYYTNLLVDARKTTSSMTASYVSIPIIMQQTEPQSIVSPILFKYAIADASYNLPGGQVDTNPANFISGFRNTSAYLFYANHRALDQDVIPASAYYSYQNALVSGMTMKGTGHLSPYNVIKTIINREWTGN